jgi:asparagine synthase (glutamine-hydrolysing)
MGLGDVWGFNGPEGYRPRQESDARTTAEFCARRYDDHRISFADGLNGTFAAVIYDRNQRTVFVLTDRLGTHPVYYARPKPETFVFSTRVQSLPIHPAVESGFDVEYLYEYFALGRVGGVKTPFTDVEELPPSSITTFDLDTGTTEIERYWQPEYEPLDRPFSYFADRFVDRFEAALDDRIDPDLTYGLLLSGGSDARAILAGVDDAVDLHTYHATGWRSRETRVAERLAAAADREFRVLQRDRDHHRRMLEETPRIMNFQGRFNEAHIVGFDDQLHEEVDVLVSGLAGDTLFREHAFPPIELDISPLGVVPLPIARRTKSVDNHIDRFADELPEYLATPPRLREILERNIELGETVVDHGIPCRSLRELVFYDDFYPFSNKSDFFYHALEQVIPHWTPFLDSRLVDLALRVPVKHRVRRNLVDTATIALDGSLARIPHGTTGVPLDRTFPGKYVREQLNRFKWKFLVDDDPPAEHQRHGPWPSPESVVRNQEFVFETIRANEALIDSLPFLDSKRVYRSYHDHLRGADNSFEIYTLLGFLRMPAVRQLAEKEAPSTDPEPDTEPN